MEPGEGQDSQEAVEDRLQSIVSLLFAAGGEGGAVPSLSEAAVPATKEDMEAARDYTLARKIDRYQAQDVMADVLEDYVELSGDGKARANERTDASRGAPCWLFVWASWSPPSCLRGRYVEISRVPVGVRGLCKVLPPSRVACLPQCI